MPPLGRDGLIVTDNRYNRDPRELYRCAEMEDAGSLEIKRGSKKVRTFRFTICRGFRNIQDEGYKYIAPPSEPVPQPVPPLEAPPSVENPSVVAPLDAPAPSLEAVEPAVAPEPEKITAEKPLEVEAPAEPAPAPVPAEPSEENDDKIPEPEMLEI